MIEYRTGDIIAEDAEALVNTVNCVGVMGRGVALQFKNAFPENFKAYAAACKRGEVQPRRMFVFETGQLTNPHYIINFPDQTSLARPRVEYRISMPAGMPSYLRLGHTGSDPLPFRRSEVVSADYSGPTYV